MTKTNLFRTPPPCLRQAGTRNSKFQAFINLKVLDLKNKLDKKEITKEQYESDIYLLNHPSRVQNGPMPNPSDFLNKDSK